MSSAAHELTAITVTAPGVVSLMPDTPRWSGPLEPDEVFGETVCSLISPGTEIAGAFRPDPSRETRYPTVPGYAAVFRVTEIGDAVTTIAVGDLVFTHGGHRSHQRKRVGEVLALTDDLDPFVAVFARLMTVPMAALSTTAARPGARVGVSGLGPIGYFAATAFAVCGYDVTAWDPRADRRSLLPRSVPSLARAPEGVERAQYGTTEGFELVLECSGHDGATLSAVRSVRSGGEVVLVGSPWIRRTDATAHELLAEIFHRYVTVRSGWEWQIPPTDQPFIGVSSSRNLDLAMRWLSTGTVRVDHLADRVSPARAQEIYEELADASTSTLTAVFDWGA
jgi:threonine dehydrogenase-like Zn-dependent dehydrogenase